MSDNSRTLLDQFGNPSDWIEISNIGTSPVSLQEYWLSDNVKSGKKWYFPHYILPPNESIIVFASGKDLRDTKEPLHCTFKLNKEKEDVFLLFGAGKIVDQLQLPFLSTDLSWGRDSNEIDNIGYLVQPSIGSFTDQKIRMPSHNQEDIILSEVQFENKWQITDEYGSFEDWVEIYNPTDKSIDVSEYYLSNTHKDVYKWRFPNKKIPPKTFQVYFASKRKDPDHVSFKLSNKDQLILSKAPDGVLEKVSLYDKSNGIAAKIDGKWVLDAHPSPNGENYKNKRQKIYISEIYPYTNKEKKEWIEIHNPTDTVVQLSNYSLHIGSLIHPLPTRELPAQGYTIIEISDVVSADVHDRLPSNGTELKLSHNAIIFYACTYGKALPSYSIGCNATKDIVFYKEPTPGKANAGEFLSKYVQSPLLTHKEGFYDKPISVSLRSTEVGTSYHFTIDGSQPTQKSPTFTEALTISKNTVLRIQGYAEGKIPSPITSASFIFEKPVSLPSIHLYFLHNDFFHYYKGIYMKGPNAESETPYKGANFWKNTEKPISFSLWDEDGHVSYQASGTIRIFGGFSRALPLKSFQVNARKEHGFSSFTFPFFPQRSYNNFSSIVLRGTGQGQYKYYFADILAFDLMQSLHLPGLAYQTVHVYLNERYWGVYNIREKLNEEYISHLYGLPKEDISILDIGIDEKNKEWIKLIKAIRKKKPNSTEYAWLKKQVDIKSLIDMLLFHIYFTNSDFGNTRVWKAKKGKWTFLVYDVDFMLDTEFNINHLFSKGGFRFRTLRVLVSWLIRLPEFREEFLQRASSLHKNQLSIQNFEQMLTNYEQKYNTLLETLHKQKIYTKKVKKELSTLRERYRKNHPKIPSLLASVLPISKKEVNTYFQKPPNK